VSRKEGRGVVVNASKRGIKRDFEERGADSVRGAAAPVRVVSVEVS